MRSEASMTAAARHIYTPRRNHSRQLSEEVEKHWSGVNPQGWTQWVRNIRKAWQGQNIIERRKSG